MNRYTVLTEEIREDFILHKDAFAFFNDLPNHPKGVFKIVNNDRVGGINLSCTRTEEYKILECHNLRKYVL